MCDPDDSSIVVHGDLAGGNQGQVEVEMMGDCEKLDPDAADPSINCGSSVLGSPKQGVAMLHAEEETKHIVFPSLRESVDLGNKVDQQRSGVCMNVNFVQTESILEW